MPLLLNKSSFNILFDDAVDYSSLQVFGYLCYVSTLVANRTKFDPRASSYVFLDYPPSMKGYRLYDISKKQICIS